MMRSLADIDARYLQFNPFSEESANDHSIILVDVGRWCLPKKRYFCVVNLFELLIVYYQHNMNLHSSILNQQCSILNHYCSILK